MEPVQDIAAGFGGSFALIVAGSVFVGMLVIGMIFAKLYCRATKEMAFVRTGFGGEKIIKDGDRKSVV